MLECRIVNDFYCKPTIICVRDARASSQCIFLAANKSSNNYLILHIDHENKLLWTSLCLVTCEIK